MKKKVIKKQPHMCKKCGEETNGFRCDICGAESLKHSVSHACGGEHCVPKCTGCGEAETICDCEII